VPELHPRLSDHTTLRLGGPASAWVRAETEAELIAAVSEADAAGEPVLVLGGGSNVVVADEGFAGTVVEVATRGIEPDIDDDVEASCSGATVKVAAGEPWDAFVTVATERRWSGIEALAGIPGLVGATPIQNVGAYGQEVSQTIASVRVWDRKLRGVRTFAAADCGFGYRTSRFKQDPGRHVVLDVTFQLPLGTYGPPLQYAELARTLNLELGQRALIESVREGVLALRTRKGMVLDPADHDTWSAGSFFTNPVIAADLLPDGAPSWPQPDGPDGRLVKTSAAWLIERAGFAKGYEPPRLQGRVALSTKHTLALTNRGDASTDDLLALAREVRDGVRERFGITLVNEPVLVGCEL
jgi:UDP-N-acetylmuramate dehydrogenase